MGQTRGPTEEVPELDCQSARIDHLMRSNQPMVLPLYDATSLVSDCSPQSGDVRLSTRKLISKEETHASTGQI